MINRTRASAPLALLALSGAALAAPGQHAASPGAGRAPKTTTGTTTTTTTGTTTGTGTTTTGTGTTTTGTGCGPGGPGGHGPGQAPALSGTLTAIDTVAGTITVTPTGGGTASVIALTSSTTLIGHRTVAASAIAVGDTLEVAGVPLSLQATSLVDNRLPDPTVAAGATGTAPPGGAAGASTTFVPGTLRIVGTVTALAPLEIEVNGSFALTLSTTSATTIAEVLPLTASQLAVGESVRVVLVKSKAGTLTALLVDVTPAS